MFAGTAAEALKDLGFEPEDFDEERVEPWPENARACHIFATFGSQWRVGMGGVIGWDYGPAMQYMAAQRYSRRKIDRLLQQLRVIEGVAMGVFQERDEKV